MTINLKFQKLKDALYNIQTYRNVKVLQEYQDSCCTDRVRRLVNVVKAKSKLINNTQDFKFNRQLQQFKILDTFIDTKSKLKKLNILNNKDLLESVKNYLIRKKITRQLGLIDVELEKMYSQYEAQFETEFDKAFLESDCFLDLGLIRMPINKSKVLSQERLQDFNRRAISQYQSSCEQKSNRDQVTKSQYDQNLFYFHIEDHIEQIKKEREEIDSFNQQLGKSIKFRTQQGDAKYIVQQQKIDKAEYDKELYKIVLQYGIDLNSTDQLEEDIYIAFKQQANEFIKQKINEAKTKYNQNIEEDQLKYKYQIKSQKKKISSIFEQQLLNISKQQYPNSKSRYKQESNIHTVTSDNRKSLVVQGQMDYYKKKDKSRLLNQFNLKSKRIINMCNQDEQKVLYNESRQDIESMNLYIDEVLIRTNFNRKLSQLGFTKEDQFLMKKQIVLQGSCVNNNKQ